MADDSDHNSYRLISGEFHPDEAREILMTLIEDKIGFHERNNWSRREHQLDTTEGEKRIAALRQTIGRRGCRSGRISVLPWNGCAAVGACLRTAHGKGSYRADYEIIPGIPRRSVVVPPDAVRVTVCSSRWSFLERNIPLLI